MNMLKNLSTPIAIALAFTPIAIALSLSSLGTVLGFYGAWNTSNNNHLLQSQKSVNKISSDLTNCIVVDAEESSKKVTATLDEYYKSGMTVQYLHGFENGDLSLCFLKDFHGEMKRSK